MTSKSLIAQTTGSRTALVTGGRGQSPTQGTDAIVAMAQVSPAGPTGTFTDASGTVPW